MPGELPEGLYEALITRGLEKKLAEIDPRVIDKRLVHRAEVPDRFALHLARAIEKSLRSVPETDRVSVGLEVLESVLDVLAGLSASDVIDLERLTAEPSMLRSVTSILPDGSPRPIVSPLISLLDTTLLTNAPKEPRVGHQIHAEIGSANNIDVLMAFVRRSGIAPMRAALEGHCERGGRLRLLTTTYTNSTEREALDVLIALGAEVRVSYDTSTTRLHAKSWLFHRLSGFSTAYIGSSNLTHSAQVAGLEWNVRVSGARNPDVIAKMAAVFDSYWETPDFAPYDPAEFDERTERLSNAGPFIFLSPLHVSPFPFQERLLEQIALAREEGHHRNLLVAATGTGKTVMAALDYSRLAEVLPRARLLFIAHRQEILDQSQATFRHVLRDPAFGEQWIGGVRPKKFEHVFASIQTLNRIDLEDLAADHFDVVIIDEFHHAAASSYQALMERVEPVELLGLTATPERTDGKAILHWFDDRIAAELRLWDAIDQQLLTPFAYFGISDGLDLSVVPWKRGIGYDKQGLTNLYTANDMWAQHVVGEFAKRVDDVSTVRALGFCVSVDHAVFMAEVFNKAGIPAVAVSASTPSEDRRAALLDLSAGRIRIVFSVDLFNEGVDVPAVDALLMLRATDSPTLFLQQLGRGLRKSSDKSLCTVLDFVGNHRREFRFDRILRALLGGSRKDVERQVEQGFPFLPAGCHMELDAVATEIVLRNIRAAVPTRWNDKAAELQALGQGKPDISLAQFMELTGLELEDIYAANKGWSDLREAAGLPVQPPGPHEEILRRAVGRLLHVDDRLRLNGYRMVAAGLPVNSVEGVPNGQRDGLAKMLLAQLVEQVALGDLARSATLEEAERLLADHPQVCSEIVELLDVLSGNVSHLAAVLSTNPTVPLRVHARYTRLEILSAFDHGEAVRPSTWREGVRWLPEEKTDIFVITLNKADGNFSPTTSYKDYAISPSIFHWESQAATRASSPTGKRYQEHAANGLSVVLFARMNQSDRAFWCLGPAAYISHENEAPMAIKWRLEVPLPGDIYTEFAAAVS